MEALGFQPLGNVVQMAHSGLDVTNPAPTMDWWHLGDGELFAWVVDYVLSSGGKMFLYNLLIMTLQSGMGPEHVRRPALHTT